VQKPNPGLRTQLLLGMVLIVLAATVSVGVITSWATRSQVTKSQLTSARMLGKTVARILGAGFVGRRRATQAAWLHQAVTGMTAGTLVRRVDVVDRRERLLASSTGPAGGQLADPQLRLALRTERQVVRAAEDRLYISSPIFVGGQLTGAVRLELPLGISHLGWPTLFWVMMAIDGLLMVLFVGLVLTRYVLKPVAAMQQAATRVTQGDLSVRLKEEGGRELASLAASFNTMSASVQDQLARLELQRKELAASREQVIRSEKLASVGRLAAGVAHEVGNPLQAIMGFTDLLQQDKLPPDERKDFLARIERETQRIHRIIRELLDYARPVEDELEPVDLAAAVGQARQLVIPQKRLHDVSIDAEALGDLPAVAANTQRLVQVLVNLLLNAADAMEGEGKITISSEVDAQRVELRVANDGPLIPTADRGRIFDPFFTTKDPGAGTGLGLSVAQAIIESYGGRLLLAEGSVTCFVLSLHRWKQEQDQQERE
jgi:two-component system NtrC family sensor kinase